MQGSPPFLIEGEGDQRTRNWEVVVQIFKEYGYELRMIEIGVFLFKFTGNPETPKPPIITRIKEKLSLLVRSNMNSEVQENESLVNKEI